MAVDLRVGVFDSDLSATQKLSLCLHQSSGRGEPERMLRGQGLGRSVWSVERGGCRARTRKARGARVHTERAIIFSVHFNERSNHYGYACHFCSVYRSRHPQHQGYHQAIRGCDGRGRENGHEDYRGILDGSCLTRGGNRADDIGSGKLGTRSALKFVSMFLLAKNSVGMVRKVRMVMMQWQSQSLQSGGNFPWEVSSLEIVFSRQSKTT